MARTPGGVSPDVSPDVSPLVPVGALGGGGMGDAVSGPNRPGRGGGGSETGSGGAAGEGGRRLLGLALLAALGALVVVGILIFGGEGPEENAAESSGGGSAPLAGMGGDDRAAAPGEGSAADPAAPSTGNGPGPAAGDPPDAAPPPDDSVRPVAEGVGPGEEGSAPPVSAGDDARGAHDPLGVMEEQEAEGVYNGARLSAANFVTYCYGYTGDDAEQYTQGVEQVVFDPEFYRSEGGRAVVRVVEAIENDGRVAAAAKLDDFRALPGIAEDEGSLRAEIRFSVGQAFAPPDEWGGGEPVLEEGSSYVQELEMARAGGRSEVWKVYQAGPVREAS